MNTKNQVKTKTKTYTTSELANLCNMIVDSISVLIKKQSLEPVKIGQNNIKYYDANILEQLRLHYAKSEPKRDKANNTQNLRARLAVVQSENQLPHGQPKSAKSTIGILRDELKVKNSQIGKLQDLTSQA